MQAWKQVAVVRKCQVGLLELHLSPSSAKLSGALSGTLQVKLLQPKPNLAEARQNLMPRRHLQQQRVSFRVTQRVSVFLQSLLVTSLLRTSIVPTSAATPSSHPPSAPSSGSSSPEEATPTTDFCQPPPAHPQQHSSRSPPGPAEPTHQA